jgi:hypothetical protein
MHPASHILPVIPVIASVHYHIASWKLLDRVSEELHPPDPWCLCAVPYRSLLEIKFVDLLRRA